VLEARGRVGGRVHSYQGDGFSAPVDLGASLVTGTAPDAQAGLGPDPVSFVCKQLGIQLHELGGELPIFDGRGQKVAPEVDVAVDRWGGGRGRGGLAGGWLLVVGPWCSRLLLCVMYCGWCAWEKGIQHMSTHAHTR